MPTIVATLYFREKELKVVIVETAIITVVKLRQEGVDLLIQDNGSGVELTDRLYENGFGLKQIKQYVETKQGAMTCTNHEGFGIAINYLMNWEGVARCVR